MNIEIEKYELSESLKGGLLLTFKRTTKNFNKINNCSFEYLKNENSLIVTYYIGKLNSFSYTFKNIPIRFKRKINNQNIILLLEVNPKENFASIMNEQDFYYESVNKKFF